MKVDNLTAKAEIRIRRTPLEVFNAFADASAMSKFWFTRRDDGLKKGESVSWSIGSSDDAYSFEVLVKEFNVPSRITIEWGQNGDCTQVMWSFEETDNGQTLLKIEESGFTGSRDTILGRVLDSTGGFNQVIVAAKALLEYGVELNVVADHV